MRNTIFRVPQQVYDHMKAYESEILQNPHISIVIDEVEQDEAGLVCLNCGNRGNSAPIEMTGYNKAKIEVTKDGELSMQLDSADVQKRYDKALTFSFWGGFAGFENFDMISNASGEIFRCLNCKSPMIMLADMAIESCINRDCSGCFVCNNYDEHEDVLDMCSNCSVAEEMMKKDDFESGENQEKYLNEQCADMDCSTLFARQSIYNIKINDILTKMRMLL
jgi:hypothetical protein